MSRKSLLAWKLYRFRTLGEKIPVFVEKKLFHQNWNPPAQRFTMRWTLKFAGWNYVDWFCTFGGPLGRVVRTAFNVSRQNFLAKKSFKKRFSSSCWVFSENIPHMVGKNWRLHQNWISLPGVSHEEMFLFLKWQDLDRLSLLTEDLRQCFQKWFLRVLSDDLTRNLVFERLAIFLSVCILSVKSGVLL